MSAPSHSPLARRGRQPAARRAGFSMIEVAVSLTILVVALTSTLRANVSTRRLATDAHERQRAVLTLRSATALLTDATPEDLADAGGEFEIGVPLDVPALLDDQVVTYELPDWTAGDPVPEVIGIRILVTWTSSERATRTMDLFKAVR